MVERDFEHVTHFPVKLWDVVDDDSNTIFTWSSDGLSFFVDDNKYEQEIMERYPGFVQISSFANLRRLLREYSFDWQSNDTGEFQFSHPSFKKGKREDIFNIRTRRKAIQAAVGQPVKPRRRNSRNSQSSADKSKAWIQPTTTGKVNLRVDTLLRFPEKFWAVVNDCNDMLYWGDNGDTVIVDDKKYEDGIMGGYPGFVQINSFANLRRLLREYGFSWSICDNGFFEFSHSHMKKDRPELLKGVKTKRKAMRAGTHHPYLPFMRGDVAYHQHHGVKGYSNGDPFEHFEQEFSTRSSPEVDHAISTIQHVQHDPARHFHHHHHSGSGDHAASMPHHMYGMPSYRMMPPYCPTMSNTIHGFAPANSWGPHASAAEKMEPPFFYHSSWNREDQEQTSPDGETAGSNSEMRISSTGSSESVYESSSKGSPTDVFQPDQLDMSSQESSPSSFPLMSMQSSVEDNYAASCHNPSSSCSPAMNNPSCTDCSIYQPVCNDTFVPMQTPLNLKTEAPSSENSPTELSLSCSHLHEMNGDDCAEPVLALQSSELNNNEIKSDYANGDSRAIELAGMDMNNIATSRLLLANNGCASNELSYHHVKKIRGYKHSDSMKIPSVN